MAAALELIDEHGPRGRGLSVRAIAAAAHVSTGALYHHFPDLDALLVAAAQRYMNDMIESVAVTTEGHEFADWRDVVDASVSAYQTYFRRRPGLREFWFDDHVSPGVNAIHQAYRSQIAEESQASLARVTGQPLDLVVHKIGIAISGALLELAFRLDPQGDPTVLEEIPVVLKDLYGQRLAAVAAAGKTPS